MTKTCSQCHVEKPLTDFFFSRHGKYGRRADCKECDAERRRKRDGAKKRSIFDPNATEKHCNRCLVVQSLENFHKNRGRKDNRESVCKTCKNKGTRRGPKKRTKEEFFAMLIPSGDCLEWPGYRNKGGYGQTGIGHGKRMLASKVAFYFHHGRWPQGGLFVLHTCDNPPCCNPEHLYEGTQYDNIHDMINRGRFNPRGRKPKLHS